MMPPSIAGFVLAGGKSSRMGTDKAVLTLEGRTLLQRALDIVRSVCGTATILGRHELYESAGPVIEDVYRDCGPLGGIHAALTQSSSELNLIIAVDTPFLTPEFLQHMKSEALKSGAVVTAPQVAGYMQPLCAVYSRAFLPVAEAALQAGRYKIAVLFPQVETRTITEAELEKFAFSAEMFENLNTPEDFRRAQERAAGPDP